MHHEVFGLARDPFDDATGSDGYCSTQVHDEALRALRRWIGGTAGAILLLGEAGSGKTLLTRRLLAQSTDPQRCACLTAARGAGAQIFQGLCRNLGIEPGVSDKELRTLTRIRHYLRNKLRTKGRFIVVVDEAQELDGETADHLAALLRDDGQGARGCQILLAGRTGAQALLQREGQSLRRHIRSLIQLPPMSLRDTATYIAQRLERAGATTELFDAQAVARVHTLGGGNPRRINRLCSAALAAAAEAGQPSVTVPVVVEATRRTAVTAPAAEFPRVQIVTESTTNRDAVEIGLPDVRPVATTAPELATPADTTASAEHTMAQELEGGTTIHAECAATVVGGAELQPTGPAPTQGCAAIDESNSEGGVEVHQAMDSLIANGEALLARLEESLDRTDSRDAEGPLEAGHPENLERGLERAVRRAEQMLKKLTGAGERIVRAVELAEAKATQAASVYQNTARLMMTRVENAQSLSRQLTTQMERVETSGREAREAEWRFQQVRTQYSGWTQQTEELATRLEHTRTAAERTGAELSRTLRGGENIAEAVTTAVHQGQKLLGDLPECVARAQETLSGLTRETQHLEQTRETWQKSATDWKSILQAAAASAEHAAESLKQRTEHASAVLDQIDASALRIAEQAARLQQCEKLEQDLARRQARLESRADDLRQQAESVLARTERSTADLVQATEEAASTQARLSETCEKLHGCEQQTADRMLALGAACERAEALQRVVEVFEKQMSKVQRSHDQGIKLLRVLKHTLVRADALAEFFRTGSETGGQHASPATMLEQLRAARHRAAKVHALLAEQTKAGQTHAESVRREVEAQLERLATQLKDQGDVETVLQEAQRVSERIHTQFAAAQEKLQALASHVAAASSAIREMAEHHQEVRADLKSWETSKSQLGEVRQQLELTVKELWEMGAAAQAQGERLATSRTEVEPLIVRLESLIQEACERAAQLQHEGAAAQQRTDALRAGGASAGKLIERLSAVTQTLQAAGALREALSSVVAQAESAQKALAASHQDATSCLEQLRGCHSQALVTVGEQRRLHEQSVEEARRLEQVCRNARQTGAEVTEVEAKCHVTVTQVQETVEKAQLVASAADDLLRQLSDKEGSIEAGDRMLREFVAQAQGLAEKLKELHVTSGKLERQIADLSAEPQNVVQEARQQAEQLDKVCKAVQKVFAGLSKVSLDATKRIEEFRKASQESDARMERLATETEEAAHTLKEWVEEAIRAQARLAATLAKSPAISTTHPQQSLYALSSSLEGTIPPGIAARLPRPAPRNGEDKLHATEPTPAASDSPVRPRTKAQVISDLIRDAQRAEQQAIQR